MRLARRLLLPAAFAAQAGIAFAAAAPAAAPPPPFRTDRVPPATLAASPATGLRLGALEIAFERTTLADVRAAAGTGAIAQEGDAGASRHWLCYTITSSPRPQRLWLVSHEMGGPEHRVMEVQATYVSARVAADGASNGCPALPRALQAAVLSTGAWLGTTADALRDALGKPSSALGNELSFAYAGKPAAAPAVRQPGGGGKLARFDRIATLQVLLRHERVESLSASQVTSR